MRLLNTAFEASLLREESRSLHFRLVLLSPQELSENSGPPEGLHRLLFDLRRQFTAHELRRLAPAVDFDRSLIGVDWDEQGQLEIWGIIHSGPDWLEQFRGGRGNASNLPDCLIIAVRDPGSIVISRGTRSLCALEAGVLQNRGFNVLQSNWSLADFTCVRDELMQLHLAARAERGDRWAPIAAELTRSVAEQMIQRLISAVQRLRHGGTLLMVPTDRGDEFVQPNAWIRLKYRFADDEARLRFRSLIVRVMNRLAALGAPSADETTVSWDDYTTSNDAVLAKLDEAIFELAYLIATLTAVDGAVVITKRFELLGFGGEIAGALPEVHRVAQALDLEGAGYDLESTDEVGTRHRSVYRLCNVLHDVLGIVISQDGGVRFVRWHESQVMYWNHNSIVPSDRVLDHWRML